jgi:hypothetical protein
MSQDNSNKNSHQINYKAIRRFVQQNLAKTKSESPISSSNHNYDDSPNDLSIASDTSVSYKNNATSLSPRNHYNEPVDNTSDNISTYSNADSLDASPPVRKNFQKLQKITLIVTQFQPPPQ